MSGPTLYFTVEHIWKFYDYNSQCWTIFSKFGNISVVMLSTSAIIIPDISSCELFWIFSSHPPLSAMGHSQMETGGIIVTLYFADSYARIPKLAIVVLGVHYEPLNRN